LTIRILFCSALESNDFKAAMRLSILLFASTVIASPFPRDSEQEPNDLIDRDCALYCGFSSQLCCSAGQVCFTDASNQAQCSTAGSVPISTVVVVPAAVTATCRTDQGQTQCGSGCCDAGQVCQGNGVCVGAQTTVTFTSIAATAVVVGQTTVMVSTATGIHL
jgi:hypothetical protein